MHKLRHSLIAILLLSFAKLASAADDYADLLAKANEAFRKKDYAAALQLTELARKSDSARYEAPALSAFIFAAQGKVAEARSALEFAKKLCPPDKTERLGAVEAAIDEAAKTVSPNNALTQPVEVPAQLSGPAKRQRAALDLIVEEADAAKTSEGRQKLLAEYLEKSRVYVNDNPADVRVWLTRAVAAMELDLPSVGHAAGVKLTELHADESNNPNAVRVLAMLERKGWINPNEVAPSFPATRQGTKSIFDGSDREVALALANRYILHRTSKLAPHLLATPYLIKLVLLQDGVNFFTRIANNTLTAERVENQYSTMTQNQTGLYKLVGASWQQLNHDPLEKPVELYAINFVKSDWIATVSNRKFKGLQLFRGKMLYCMQEDDGPRITKIYYDDAGMHVASESSAPNYHYVSINIITTPRADGWLETDDSESTDSIKTERHHSETLVTIVPMVRADTFFGPGG